MIKIEWTDPDEYVDIDLVAANQNWGAYDPTVATTHEYYPESETTLDYNVRCSHSYDGDRLVIRIRHNLTDNPHLRGKGVIWGTSIITINRGAREGTAEWISTAAGYAIYNGCMAWSEATDPADEPLIAIRNRISVNVIARKQARFRANLLTLGANCALTGEATVRALEAAHIVPAADGGTEKTANGILLRADLHRLFDAGAFRISNNGHVNFAENAMSKKYRDFLRGKYLNAQVLERVQVALERRNDLYNN